MTARLFLLIAAVLVAFAVFLAVAVPRVIA